MVVYICMFSIQMNYKRYFPPAYLESRLKNFNSDVKRTVLGRSVNGLPVYQLKIGNGDQNILMWSQMHGNETTTTIALLDFISWLSKPEQSEFLNFFTFFIIPQLNPDGSKLYTRLNLNGVDLNRDAIEVSQPESIVLRNAYEKILPQYAINLHGQRTIYGSGPNGLPATISFLSPSADSKKSITSSRVKAMIAISSIRNELEKQLPGAIGRYDDKFNPNCVGDYFTKCGTPTILFEAGHYVNDYYRVKVRFFILEAYKILFKNLMLKANGGSVESYLSIPQNTNNYVDLIVSNITIKEDKNLYENQQLAIQYTEKLENQKIIFLPSFMTYGKKLKLKAHNFIDFNNIKKYNYIIFKKDAIINTAPFNKLFSLNSFI